MDKTVGKTPTSFDKSPFTTLCLTPPTSVDGPDFSRPGCHPPMYSGFEGMSLQRFYLFVGRNQT